MKFNSLKYLILLLCLVGAKEVNAEKFFGSLMGRVVDAETNLPIENAVLKIN